MLWSGPFAGTCTYACITLACIESTHKHFSLVSTSFKHLKPDDIDNSGRRPVHRGPNISTWITELPGDPDRDYLVNGITHGFHIIDPNMPLKEVCVQNHNSALAPDVKEVMDQIIRHEYAENNYVLADTPPTTISALGTVPKSEGGIRPMQPSTSHRPKQLCSRV